MSDSRQEDFKMLEGKTIDFVDAKSINVIHIHTKCGEVISIDSEQSHYGIPVIQIAEYTE